MPLPQQVSSGPAHVGPAVAPSGNQGNAAMAMIDVQNAVKLLEKALPMIPMGSPLHGEILNVAKSLSKHLSKGDDNQALGLQSLLQMAKQNQQASPVAALARMFPGANAPPAMGGGGAPPSPEPQAAA